MSTSEDPKAVIRRWNDEGWSGGNYDLAHEIIAPVMTVHGAGGQSVGMGPEGLIDLITLVGYYLALSRIIETLRIPLPEGISSLAFAEGLLNSACRPESNGAPIATATESRTWTAPTQ